MSLSNAWGDYDMDGDLDCVVFKTGDVRHNNEFGGFINVGPDLSLPIGGKERRVVAWGDMRRRLSGLIYRQQSPGERVVS